MRSTLLLIIGLIFLILAALINNNLLIPLLLFLAGVILIIIGYYDLKSSLKRDNKDIEMIIEANNKNYRKEADYSIEVFLKDCYIITKDQFISIDRSNYSEAQMLDSVFNKKLSETRKNISSQILKYTFKNKTYYSKEINMDKNNLKIRLFLQKKTNIYIKNNSPIEYFFDLDFLKKQA